MTFDQIVSSRRSVRKYKADPVPEKDLTAILEAGRLAPSAKNTQNWHFTAVQNAAAREKLVDACSGQAMVGEAPVALVVWAESDRLMSCGQSAASVDCSIALSFMMLKATELGLGTCWLGAFDPEAVKTVLGLPAEATVVSVMPVGYADEAPAARPRKALGEVSEVRG